MRHPVRPLLYRTGCFFLFLWVLLTTAPLVGQSTEPATANLTRGKVIVIPIHGDIESGVSFFVQRMLRRADQEQAAALVLEINSNGGLVSAAQEIKTALLESRVKTIAYVKGRALSAAALIAISCQKILMEPGAEMGAATPIQLMGDGVRAAEEKFVSAFRAEFESAAEKNRRPTNLAGAMVDKNHDEIPGLVKRGEILTLTTEKAATHGYCDFIVSTLESGLRQMKIEPTPLERVEPTSGEWIARWLTNPNISVLLFSAGVWLIILEFAVFGWGLLGWLGLLLLALFFGGHLFAYLAGLEAVLLFVFGMVLLLIEFFIIPGFGLTGIAGILSLCMSIIMVFGGIYSAIYAIGKIMAISILMIVALYHFAPRLKLFDGVVLKQELTTEAGFVAVDNTQFDHLLNLEGITQCPCRPAGIARIGTERVDVVSEGDFIERNQRVVVVRVEGQKIVVRELKA
ncbi:MAG TPA: NfeD family protein [Candidatus Ozemobacteraceae bacterium]|nr:NfeD family protein [Candidatus Ozemobacteraceae bacterium]